MKQCAYCGGQNEDSAVKCRGCGESLEKPAVPAGTAALKDPANAPVMVASLHSLEEAELLKAELEAAGIEAFIPEEYTTGVFSGIIPFQQVTVQVPASDAEAAKAIAAAFAAASCGEGEGSDEPDPKAGARPWLNQAPESAESAAENQPGKARCVSCGAQIPLDSILCPKCGWTQPRLA
ncbi:MAG TPA: DUF2007 domain-containing protein [Verrucomicrobiae bacterium]